MANIKNNLNLLSVSDILVIIFVVSNFVLFFVFPGLFLVLFWFFGMAVVIHLPILVVMGVKLWNIVNNTGTLALMLDPNSRVGVQITARDVLMASCTIVGIGFTLYVFASLI